MLKTSKYYKIVSGIGVAIAMAGVIGFVTGLGFIIKSAYAKPTNDSAVSSEVVEKKASAEQIGGEVGVALGAMGIIYGGLAYAVDSENYKKAKLKEEGKSDCDDEKDFD